MNLIKKAEQQLNLNQNKLAIKDYSQPLSFADREASIRTWIAKNESVCPYAPGLAYFTYLPEVDRLDMSLVRFLVLELRKFYAAKVDGERVGRWMLLPNREWQDHVQAREESETIFWALAAAYFYLRNDRRRVKLALSRSLPGYAYDHQGDLTNPVVGCFARAHSKRPHPKSLFCSALSPLYRYEKFYRYAPSSVLVMVYALEFFEEKEKNERAVRNISLDMAHSNLLETFGRDLEIDKHGLKKELLNWESLIAQSLSIVDKMQAADQCLTSCMMDRFRKLSPQIVQVCMATQKHQLPVLNKLCQTKGVTVHQVLCAHFSGAGLYTIPQYI